MKPKQPNHRGRTNTTNKKHNNKGCPNSDFASIDDNAID